MANEKIFHSLTQKIPEIRRDLEIIPIRDENRELLYFHDAMGYVPPNFALDASAGPLLSIFSGAFSLEDISRQLNGQIKKEELLGFVQLLDEHAILNSRNYQKISEKTESEFEKSNNREPALAGLNYPENPDELSSFLKGFEEIPDEKTSIEKNSNALYAPHLDIRIAKDQYFEAFSAIRNLKPKNVVILATAHYSGHFAKVYEQYPFIGSAKQFRIPGRTFKPNKSVLHKLAENSSENGFTLKDRAHRVEHSIEIHLLFASQIWKHDFTITPILIGSFDELFYHDKGDLAHKIDRFTSQLRDLITKETFVLISGDLSHVGKKFGDEQPASKLREKIEKFDKEFLEISKKGNAEQLLKHVTKDYDASRVCGFPPLYTFLKMFPKSDGKQINYFWWDEKERESAVSVGSLLY